MRVLRPDQRHTPEGGTAVTIGAYDGVHLGHRHLLARLGTQAADRGLATAVVTFDRHPATVVRPASAPLLLTDLDQKQLLSYRTRMQVVFQDPDSSLSPPRFSSLHVFCATPRISMPTP